MFERTKMRTPVPLRLSLAAAVAATGLLSSQVFAFSFAECAAQGGFCDASNTCVKLRTGDLAPLVLGSCETGGGGGGPIGGGGGIGGGPSLSPCQKVPSDETCTGKDPVSNGCTADAFTSQNGKGDLTDSSSGQVRTGGTVELRYSPSCMSAWAVVKSSKGNANIFARIRAVPDLGVGGLLQANGQNVRQLNSPMFYAPAPRTAEATGIVTLSDGTNFAGSSGLRNPRRR